MECGKSEVNKILSGHSSSITDIQLDQHNRFVASSSLDRTVRLWPLQDARNQPIVLNDHDNWVASLCFSNEHLFSGSYSGTLIGFELDPAAMTVGLCAKIGRNLTEEEWSEYIGTELAYRITCNE